MLNLVFRVLCLFTKLDMFLHFIKKSLLKWVKVIEVRDEIAVKRLSSILDLGESEAIIIAKELNANLLIIDERKGRKIAEQEGLEIIGLVGVLIRAKVEGHITNLKPVLDELIDEIGFRVSRRLYDMVLNQVGE